MSNQGEWEQYKEANGVTRFRRRVIEGVANLSWFKELTGGGSVGHQHNTGYNYDGYGSYNSSPTNTNKGGSGYKASPVGYIRIVDKDGKTVCEKDIDTYWKDWWKLAVGAPVEAGAFQLYEEEGKTSLLVIPDTAVKFFSESQLFFNACTYNAAKDYVESFHGLRLHDTDKEWLGRHPFATDDGIPQEYTATAIHQLVAPYGLGVFRIRFRAGMLNAGDEVMNWSKALGCNPDGLIDHRTTNVQAAEKMGLPLEQINDLFRFEYHEQPYRPSIIGEKGWSSNSSTSVSTGNKGGHATYLAPRMRENDWVVSIQLAPLSECRYQSPPTLPAYKRRTGARTVVLDDIIDYLDKDGTRKIFAIKKNTNFYSPEEMEKGGAHQSAGFQTQVQSVGQETQQEGTQGSTHPSTTTVSHSSAVSGLRHSCEVCLQKFELAAFPQDMFVCRPCLLRAWTAWTCSKCKGDLGKVQGYMTNDRLPNYVPATGVNGKPIFLCPYPSCRAEIGLPEKGKGTTMFEALKEGARRYEAYVGQTAPSTPQEPWSFDNMGLADAGMHD